MEEAKKKILIIEDDKSLQAVLKILFERNGYQVFSAFDAMQGIMMARQSKPDLIVLDMMMPAGGGFPVYERIRMMPASSKVPFLIYSAMDRATILEKIKETPSVMILSKGSDIEQLVDAVARLLSV